MWYTWLTETKYAIARGVFATATYEGGLNLILAPLCEGALGPLPQRSRQTLWCALGQPLKKTTLGRLVQAANLEFNKIGRLSCSKKAINWPTDANSL